MKTKQHKGILIVVSGFSGAGKGTLMKRLVSDYDNYALSVSMNRRSRWKRVFLFHEGRI